MEFRPGINPSPEVLRYFQQKQLKPSFSWKDVWGEEHAHAFTVAKSAGFDILGDVREALNSAITNGTPFKAFREGLEPLLKAKGWWGVKRAIDPKTKEPALVQLGSPRRLKVIYEANIRSARAAGQFERAQRVKAALPFFEYSLGPSENHRPLHQEKAGLILPVDDPFWDEWYPPNGWGCKCWLRQITKAAAETAGGPSEPPQVTRRPYVNSRTGEVTQIPRGIDPGWATSPGRARARTLADGYGERLAVQEAAPARAEIAKFWAQAGRAYTRMAESAALPVGHNVALAETLAARSPLIVAESSLIAGAAELAGVAPETLGAALVVALADVDAVAAMLSGEAVLVAGRSWRAELAPDKAGRVAISGLDIVE